MIREPTVSDFAEEAWFDQGLSKNTGSLIVAFRLSEMPAGSHITTGEPFYAEIGSGKGCAGYIKFEFIASLDGRALFQATELYPASARDQLPVIVTSLLSSRLLVYSKEKTDEPK